MIAFLEGMVRFIRKDSILMDVHSVGYEVFVAEPSKYSTEQILFLFTYQQFKEDDQVLFGFESEVELDLFTRLVSVRGIGTRTALSCLRAYSPQRLIQLISDSDQRALQKIPGIGARSAGQIILDLRGKVEWEEPEKPSAWKQAKEALMSLGYSMSDLNGLDSLIDMEGQSLEELIRSALRLLATRKGLQ